jgi:hypothetical protein
MPSETTTPNIGLQIAAYDQANWQVPTNFNWNLLDEIFGGEVEVPALWVGTLTAESITGLGLFGVVTVPFTVTPVFDATAGQEFKITLTDNVLASTFINGVSGPSIIVFRIVQDGVGGRTFVWPTNVRNGGIINADANGRSVQAFAVDTDGSLDATGPMMYS